MKTIEKDSTFRTGNESALLPPISVDALRRRLASAMEALEREAWLPIGLRAAVAEELREIKRLVSGPEPTLEGIGERLVALAAFVYSYGDEVKESETGLLIRALDLEWEDRRRLARAPASSHWRGVRGEGVSPVGAS